MLTAYTHVRVERPDEHLLARARLVSEMELLATLLRAVAARDEVATEATGSEVTEIPQPSLGGLRMLHHLSPIVEDQHSRNTFLFWLSRCLLGQYRHLQTATQMRNNPM